MHIHYTYWDYVSKSMNVNTPLQYTHWGKVFILVWFHDFFFLKTLLIKDKGDSIKKSSNRKIQIRTLDRRYFALMLRVHLHSAVEVPFFLNVIVTRLTLFKFEMFMASGFCLNSVNVRVKWDGKWHLQLHIQFAP